MTIKISVVADAPGTSVPVYVTGPRGLGIASTAWDAETGILTVTYTDARTETVDLSGTFTARDAAIVAQAAAEAAQAAAETAETNAETAGTDAATSETNAATSEANAAASETAAAGSASAAAASETAAGASETAAVASASAAAASETNAGASETNAAASASAASTSAINAAASETNAAASETAAGASETAAAASEAAASTSETNAAASEAAAETARDGAVAVAPSLSASIGNVSAVLGQAYKEIERLSETQQGYAYTLNLVLELASLIGALSDQVNGGQASLRGGTLADPALRIGTVGIYSSAADTLSIAIAETEVARITASGITIYGTVTETP